MIHRAILYFAAVSFILLTGFSGCQEKERVIYKAQKVMVEVVKPCPAKMPQKPFYPLDDPETKKKDNFKRPMTALEEIELRKKYENALEHELAGCLAYNGDGTNE